MNLSYQHANPSTGGGSYLLRFREDARERTPCLLVDSGSGVDLDDLLADDEYLAAVVLTHAHLDHYATLADSLRDGAPVYAAEPTANVLADVLTEGEKNYDIGATDSVLDRLEPLDGWATVVPDVEVFPVPAGHAPGAAGFLVRFRADSRANHLLFTGDFTSRRVAGYPGLDTDLPANVDALFVNVSTTDDFEGTLSESLFTVTERATAGSSVLVTASALTGLHVAYLLGHLGDRLDKSIPVTLAGQVAKLYADLGYDVPNVDPVAVFEDPSDLLDRGGVTVAGPEVPNEGSARKLFDAIADDASATLVQLTGGATDPVETAASTVYDYQLVNHPDIEVIDDLVTAFDPIHVVAGHGPRSALRQFRGRYDQRFVWASDDHREQTIYVDGRWSSPPWLSEPAVQSIRARDWRSNGLRVDDAEADDLPRVTRMQAADLDAEGLDVERFEARFDGPTGESADFPVADDAAAEAEPEGESTASKTVSDAAESQSDAVVEDPEAFRRAVLDRLDALEPGSTGATGRDPYRARVVEAGEDATLLRLLGDADLDHGEEVSVVVSDSGAASAPGEEPDSGEK
ncbi:MBL fold metallo-hydrolase [Halorussus litoreus]|uniref:MBL fold metallo-hydrolase n=1 Tax=Halorussus litoreus TaxID=1710536 RepID=UPI000E275948|nr:MBL fold metallo-hydrolase [Halorussus litoreus]